MTEKVKCLGCGDMFRPNSAKQTHYCCSKCGDQVRNRKKRDRRIALERNIRILHTYKIPVGYTRQVGIEDLKRQGFDFEAHSHRMNIPFPDGITFSTKLCFGPYLLYNEENKTYIKYF
jgi:predicted RNA-binding Zn-ribbon protein involved in translation (DUF1610 family)